MTLLGHILIHFTENFACVKRKKLKMCVCVFQTISMILMCVNMAYRTFSNN